MPEQEKRAQVDQSTQIETRLLVVAEMLERAVAEVRRAMDEIKTGDRPPAPTTPDPEGRQTDGSR